MIDQTLVPQEGIFAVYKDEGMTSHDVIDVVRSVTRQKRVGHAGTLDPCAKGVLVVAVGRAATKTLGEIPGSGFSVRAFARDLGEALGTGGYVDQLERTRVGAFTKEQAVRISNLQSRSPHGGPEGPNPDAVP